MLFKDVCRRVVTRAKSNISDSLSLMKSVNMRGLFLEPRPNLGAQTDRGFKTGSKLNYMRRLSKEERIMESYRGDKDFVRFGQGAAVGAAAFGLGGLSLYGFGLFDEVGAIMASSTKWPERVRKRITLTYTYFAGSYVISVLSAAAVFQSSGLVYLLSVRPTTSLYFMSAALLLTDTNARSIPYQPGFGKKQLLWLVHYALFGITAIPLYRLGGPLILRAAMLTAGVIGGLSIAAVSAPSKKFLEIGAPVGMGFGLVFASSTASIFVPPFSALAPRWLTIPMYAALSYFAIFVLRDMTKVIKRAESLIPSNVYDPLKATISIYVTAYKALLSIIRLIEVSCGGKR